MDVSQEREEQFDEFKKELEALSQKYEVSIFGVAVIDPADLDVVEGGMTSFRLHAPSAQGKPFSPRVLTALDELVNESYRLFSTQMSSLAGHLFYPYSCEQEGLKKFVEECQQADLKRSEG